MGSYSSPWAFDPELSAIPSSSVFTTTTTGAAAAAMAPIRPLQIQPRNANGTNVPIRSNTQRPTQPIFSSTSTTTATVPPPDLPLSSTSTSTSTSQPLLYRIPSHRSVSRNPYKARAYPGPHAAYRRHAHTRTISKSDALRASVFETAVMAIGLEGIGEIVTEGADMGRRESRRRARVGGAFGSGADGGLGDDERSAEGIIEEEDETDTRTNPAGAAPSSSAAGKLLMIGAGSEKKVMMIERGGMEVLDLPGMTSSRGRSPIDGKGEDDATTTKDKSRSKSKEKKGGWRRKGKSARRADDDGEESEGGYLSEAFGFRRKKKGKDGKKSKEAKLKKGKAKGTATDIEGGMAADAEDVDGDTSDIETNLSHAHTHPLPHTHLHPSLGAGADASVKTRRMSLSGVGNGMAQPGALFTTTTSSSATATASATAAVSGGVGVPIVSMPKRTPWVDDGYATDSNAMPNGSNNNINNNNGDHALAMYAHSNMSHSTSTTTSHNANNNASNNATFDFLTMPPPPTLSLSSLPSMATTTTESHSHSHSPPSSKKGTNKSKSKKYFGLFKLMSVPLAAPAPGAVVGAGTSSGTSADFDGRDSQDVDEKKWKEPTVSLPIAERFARKATMTATTVAEPVNGVSTTSLSSSSGLTSQTTSPINPNALTVPQVDSASSPISGSLSAPVTRATTPLPLPYPMRAASPMVGASVSEGSVVGGKVKRSLEMWDDRPVLKSETRSGEKERVEEGGSTQPQPQQRPITPIGSNANSSYDVTPPLNFSRAASPVSGQSPRSPFANMSAGQARARSPFMVPISMNMLQSQVQERKGSFELSQSQSQSQAQQQASSKQLHSPSSSTSTSSVTSGFDSSATISRSSNTSATSASSGSASSPTRTFNNPLTRVVSATKERHAAFLSPKKDKNKQKDGKDAVQRSLTISAPNPHLAGAPERPPSPTRLAEALASRSRGTRPGVGLQVQTGLVPNPGLLRPVRSPIGLPVSPMTPESYVIIGSGGEEIEDVRSGGGSGENRAGVGAGRQYWGREAENRQEDVGADVGVGAGVGVGAEAVVESKDGEKVERNVRFALPPMSPSSVADSERVPEQPDSPVIPSSAFLVPSPMPSPRFIRNGFVVDGEGSLALAPPPPRASVLAYYDIPPPSPAPVGPLPSIPRDFERDVEREREQGGERGRGIERELTRIRKRVGFADENGERMLSPVPTPVTPYGPGRGIPRAPSPLSIPRSPSPYSNPASAFVSPSVSRSATPTQGIYNQTIPSIQRGKESPFPSRPILPREESRNLIRRPSAAAAAAVRDARRAREAGTNGIATGRVAVEAYHTRVARYRGLSMVEDEMVRPDSPVVYKGSYEDDVEEEDDYYYDEEESSVERVSESEHERAFTPSQTRSRMEGMFENERQVQTQTQPWYVTPAPDDGNYDVDPNADADTIARSSVYSRYSIMDEDESKEVRDRFVRRVEEMYAASGAREDDDPRRTESEEMGEIEDDDDDEEIRESIYGGIARDSVFASQTREYTLAENVPPPVPLVPSGLKPGLASLRMRAVSPTSGLGVGRGGLGVGRGLTVPAGRVMPLQVGSNRF